MRADGRRPAWAAGGEAFRGAPEGADAQPPEPPSLPAEVAAVLERARAHEAAGIDAGALAMYRELVALQPREPTWRMELARMLEQQGQPDAAVAELDRALDAHPDHLPLLAMRGALLVSLRRYERAEADLRRAVKLDEQNVPVLTGLGNLALRRGRWRDGLEPLRRATELDPTSGPAFYYLGEVYHQLNQLVPALSAYERAVELDPSSARALKAVGNVLDRLGRHEEAAVAHRRVLDVQRR